MRIVANRTGFYKVSMSTENIIHVHYIIQSKDTSIALLQHYSVFASSPLPDYNRGHMKETKLSEWMEKVCRANIKWRKDCYLLVYK